jgi:hypothetical protein
VSTDLPALSELAERDADPRSAAVYGELKRLGGVPMVALIFRHLATLPGGLGWAWDTLGPAWRRGAVQETAWGLTRQLPLEALAPMPREALAVLGVDEAGLEEMRTVLQAYNRANPENLLSVLCLSRLAGGARATHALSESSAALSTPSSTAIWQPPVAPTSLPPMAALASLPPELARLLDLVADPDAAGRPRLVPSLYRHLAHRPGLLALVVTLLMQRMQDGSIDRSVDALQASMNAAADALAPTMSAPPAPHPEVLPALQRFGGGVIARMIVVGAMLERALPA